MSIPSTPAGWTGARVEALAALWRDGLSASQIAGRLGGVTRNAVIGKLHRLGLAGRPKPAAPRGPRLSPAPAKRPRRRSVPLQSVARTPATDGPGLAPELTALTPQACRWPIGDPKSAAFSFCGQAAARGGVYCVQHARRAHRPGSARPLLDDPYLRQLFGGGATRGGRS